MKVKKEKELKRENIFKKVLIIGNSPKFIKYVKEKINYNFLKVISWRGKNQKRNNIYDLIFVCGYNFNTYGCNFEEFQNLNIIYPLKKIVKHSNKKSLVIFINTYDQKQKYTYSRYKYAKIKLAYLISKRIKKFVLLNVPLITDNDSKIMIKSSFVSLCCLSLLIKLRLIETIKIKKLYKLIDNCFERLPIINNANNINNINGRYLQVPRTQFVDKILRFILDR